MRFRAGVRRDVALILPVCVDDWIGPDHVVRIIDPVVEALDLADVEATFHATGPGSPAYPPKLLWKVFVYGYLTGRFSSRRISQAGGEDLGLLWLTCLEQPKHSVLAAVRQRHVADLPGWMAQVIAMCADLGMVGWQLGAVDGSKFRADASKHKAMSYGRMKERIPALEAELAALLAAHAAADATADPPPIPARTRDPEEPVRQEADRVPPTDPDFPASLATAEPAQPVPAAEAIVAADAPPPGAAGDRDLNVTHIFLGGRDQKTLRILA